MKLVAEIFNPERFTAVAKQFHLQPGEAFDIELGWDLLNRSHRQSVRHYIQTEKLGLVILSPPCTPLSSLQHLNLKLRANSWGALKRHTTELSKAKTLLIFAMEICQLCLSMGISFLYEHPRSASSWHETCVNQLLKNPVVHVSCTDQCQFGLRSASGNPERKRTGFVTNHREIAELLNRKCRGEHSHEHIIGSDERGKKSSQSQVYPKGLVSAVLKTHQQSPGKYSDRGGLHRSVQGHCRR